MVLWGLFALLTLLTPPPAQVPTSQPDVFAPLLDRVVKASRAGDAGGILALCDGQGDSREEFATALARPAPSRIVVTERDRATLEPAGLRVMIEVFVERGFEGAVSTWRLDVLPGPTADGGWRISTVTRLSVVTGLYRLSLNPSKQFDVRDLTVRAPDITLTMASGTAFVAETLEGPTAVVLLGRGRLRFAPPAEAERTQVRIFGGSEVLSTEVDAAFIRVRPAEFPAMFDPASLVPRPASQDDLRRATAVFESYIGRTLQIDLSGISRDRWSLTPASNDIILELRTRRFGTLTYARSNGDAEDISFFDRRHRHNISVYRRRPARGSRPLLQRGRPRRLRRARLRPRRRGHARSRVHQRQRPAQDQDPRGRHVDADVPPRREPGRARRLFARLRTPAPPPGRRPDEPHRQPAHDRHARHRALDRRRVRRARAGADVRSRGAGRSVRIRRSRFPSRSSRDCSSATGATGIRSRPSPTTRRRRCGSRCRRSTR